ncbi:MAG: FixH family protein [Planctomycetota bacterium]|nr:FixH family protein [Planctomycetota bacterium]
MVSPRTFWVGMIVGLLSLSVGVNLLVLFKFAESPKKSLEENWEAKAENWNEFQVQHTINRKLGWKLDVIEDQPSGANPVAYLVTLTDKEKNAIQGATITLKTSHNAHYAERQLLHAEEIEAGRYRIEMSVPYSGMWQFHGEVQTATLADGTQGEYFTQAWAEKLETPASQ